MNFKEKFIAFYTIVHREWVRTFRVKVGTLLPPAITTTLYFVIFGHVIGQRIGVMEGYPYPQFIAPGLIMMSVITNAYACTVSAFFGLKFHRDIEEILVTPMPYWIMLAGYVVAGMARGLLVGTIVTAIALLFTHLHMHSVITVIFVTLLSSAIFSLGGILNAIYAKTFDHISIIPTFVLTPLTYLGGVFYSITLLSPFWQTVSMINPIVYIIKTFRFGILGVAGQGLVTAFIVMLAVAAVMFYFTLWLIRRGIGTRL